MGQQFFKSRALPLVAICIIAVATLAGGYFGSPRVVHVAAGTPDADEELRKEFQEALDDLAKGIRRESRIAADHRADERHGISHDCSADRPLVSRAAADGERLDARNPVRGQEDS